MSALRFLPDVNKRQINKGMKDMIKALIVDDEPAVAAIITYFINREHIPIEVIGTAVNGRRAVELIKSQELDLVFLDIQMPLMNGFEVMKECPNAHYIIITAYESFEYAQQALRLGAKDILLKPIEYKQFMQAINRAIGWQFTSNTMVNNILEYIDHNYAHKIELNQIAQQFYTTSSHISRLFKKHMGVSLMNYVNQVRIEKAVKLLDSGAYSIKAVAELTGYDSLNNFYKYFKVHKGITPAAYCQRIKAGDQEEGS